MITEKVQGVRDWPKEASITDLHRDGTVIQAVH